MNSFVARSIILDKGSNLFVCVQTTDESDSDQIPDFEG